MTWRYQATHRTLAGDSIFEVREVFWDTPLADGLMWTEDARAPYGDTKAELIECLQMMLKDVQHFDVLEVDE